MRREDRLNLIRGVFFAIIDRLTRKDIPRTLVLGAIKQLVQSEPELGYEFETGFYDSVFFADLEELIGRGDIYLWQRARLPRITYIVVDYTWAIREAWEQLSSERQDLIKAIVNNEMPKIPAWYFQPDSVMT
jgi:hypothetical protein